MRAVGRRRCRLSPSARLPAEPIAARQPGSFLMLTSLHAGTPRNLRVPPSSSAAPMSGQFYQPTVLTCVTPDMRIYHEESFGPVVSLFRADDFEDALRIANDTDDRSRSGRHH